MTGARWRAARRGTALVAALALAAEGAAPTVLTSSLDLANGALSIQASETLHATLHDPTKITLTFPAVPGSPMQLEVGNTISLPSADTLTLTLSEEQRSAAVARSSNGDSGPTLTLAAGAFANAASEDNAVSSDATISVVSIDETAPTLEPASTYALGTNVLTMTFSEYVPTIDTSKIFVSGVALDSATAATAFDKTVTLTVASNSVRDQLVELVAGGTTLQVQLETGAVLDEAGNDATAVNIDFTLGTLTVEADAIAPTFSSAEVNLATGVLQITFSEYIDHDAADLTKITLHIGSVDEAAQGAVADTLRDEVLVIQLDESQRAAMAVQAAADEAMTLDLAAGAVADRTGNAQTAVSAQSVPVTKDLTAPSVADSQIDLSSGVLTLQASETLHATLHDPTKITLTFPDEPESPMQLEVGNTISVPSTDTLTLTLSEEQRSAAVARSSNGSSGPTLTLAAGAFADAVGNEVAAVTDAGIGTVSGDLTAPFVVSSSYALGTNVLTLTLSEYVPAVDASKMLVDGLALQPATTVTAFDKTVTVTVTSNSIRDQLVIAFQAGTLQLELQSAALTDDAGNSVAPVTADLDATEADATSPVFDSSVFDVASGIMNVTFSEYIDHASADLTKITVLVGSVNEPLDGNVDDSVRDETLRIQMAEAQRTAVAGQDASGHTLTLDLAEGAVVDRSSNAQTAATGRPVTTTSDGTGPTVASSSINLVTGVLTIQASETLHTTNSDPTKITLTFSSGDPSITLTVANTISLPSADTLATSLSEEQRSQAVVRSSNGAQGPTLSLAGGAFADASGNLNPSTVVAFSSITSDETLPVLLSTTYSLGLNQLTMTFSEYVPTVDASLISVSGQTLDPSAVATSVDKRVVIAPNDLSIRDELVALDIAGTALEIQVLAGAIFDASGNEMAPVTMDADAVQPDAIAPTFSSAEVNLATGVLQITFSEYIDHDAADLAKITLHIGSVDEAAQGAVADTLRDEVLVIQLDERQRAAMAVQAAADEAMTLDLAAGAVADRTGNAQTAVSAQSVTVTKDLTAPSVAASQIDLSSGVLTLQASETLHATLHDPIKITLTFPDEPESPMQLEVGNTISVPSTDTLTLTLSEEQRSAAVARSSNGSSGPTLTLAAGAFADAVGNEVAAVTDAGIGTVSGDLTAPFVVSSSYALGTNVLTLTLSEHVPTVNASQIQVSGFTMQPSTVVSDFDKSVTVTVDSADTRDALVALHLAETALQVQLLIDAIADQAGNPATAATAAITSVEDDSVSPEVVTVSLDLGTGALDLTFSEVIEHALADVASITLKIGDYQEAAQATVPDTTRDTILSIQLAESQRAAVAAKVSASETLTVDLAAGLVQDRSGNALTPQAAQDVDVDPDLTPPTLVAAQLSLETGLLTLQASETVHELLLDPTNIVLTFPSGGADLPLNVSNTMTITSTDTLTLTLSEEQRTTAIQRSSNGSAGPTISVGSGAFADAAGNANSAALNAAIGTVESDSTAPTLVSSMYALGPNVFTMTLSEYAPTVDASKVRVGGLALQPSSVAVAFDKTAVITVDSNSIRDQLITALAQGPLQVEILADAIVDAAGTSATPITVGVTETQADATKPEVVSAAIDLGTGVMTLEFTEFIAHDSADPSLITARIGSVDLAMVASVSDDELDETLVLQISESIRADFAEQDELNQDMAIDIAALAVLDRSGNALTAATSLPVQLTSDQVAPTLYSALLDLGTGVLTIQSSETLHASQHNASQISITFPVDGENPVALTADNAITIAGGGDTFTLTLTEEQRSAAVTRSSNGDSGPTLTLGVGAFEDVVGNQNVATVNAVLQGGIVKDQTQPALVSSAFDLGTNTLTLTMTEYVPTVDASQIEVGGLAMQPSTVTVDFDSTVTIVVASSSIRDQLVAAHLDNVVLQVQLLAGAAADTAGNAASTSIQDVDAVNPDSVKPAFASAALDLNDGTLAISMSEYIDHETANPLKISVRIGPIDEVLDATVTDTVRDEILHVQLAESQRAGIAVQEAAGQILLLDLADVAVVDRSDNAQEVADSRPVAVTADTTAPAMLSAQLDLATGLLTIQASETVHATQHNASLVSLTFPSGAATLELSEASNTIVAANADTLTTTLTEEQRSAAITRSNNGANAPLLSAASGAFADAVGNANTAVVAANLDSVASDQAVPSLVSSTYALGPNTLTMTFTEYLPELDTSKVVVNGLPLLPSTVVTGFDKTAVVTVASNSIRDQLVTLHLDNTPLEVQLLEDAASDTAGNNVTVVTAEIASVIDDTIQPTITSAALDLGTGVMTVVFSQFIVHETAQIHKLTAHVGSVHQEMSGTITDTVRDETLEFQVEESMRVSIAVQEHEGNTMTTNVAAGMASDRSGNAMASVTGVTVELTPDTVAPTLQAAQLDLATGLLTMEASEAVHATLVDPTMITLEFPSNTSSPVSLTAENTITVAATSTLTLTLSEEQRSQAITRSDNGANAPLLSAAPGAFSDAVGNANVAAANATIGTVSSDGAAPTLVSSTFSLGDNSLVLTFSEYVPTLDAAQISVGGYALAPSSVVLAFDRTATISVDSKSIHDELVTLDLANTDLTLQILAGAVADTAANALAPLDSTVTVVEADTVKPTFSSAALDLNDGELRVTFSEFVDQDTADPSRIRAVIGPVDEAVQGAVVDSVRDDVLVIHLAESQRAAIAVQDDLGQPMTIDLADGVTMDRSTNTQSASTGQAVTLVPDDTFPLVAAAQLNLATGSLVIQASEMLHVTATDLEAIGLSTPETAILLLGLHLNGASSGPAADPIQVQDDSVLVVLSEEQRVLVTNESANGVELIRLQIGAEAFHDVVMNPVQSANDIVVETVADNVDPVYESGRLTLGDGVLALQLSEYVDVVDLTKIELDGRQLVDSAAVAEMDGSLVFTFSTHAMRDHVVLSFLAETDITVDIQAGALMDIAGNDVLPDQYGLVAIEPDVTLPLLTHVSLDHNADTFTFQASETVQLVDWTKVTFHDSTGAQWSFAGAGPAETRLDFTYSMSHVEQVRAALVAFNITSVDFEAGAFQDLSGNANAAAIGVTLNEEIADVTLPQVGAAPTLDLADGTLTLHWTEAVELASLDFAKISLVSVAADATRTVVPLGADTALLGTNAAFEPSATYQLIVEHRVFAALEHSQNGGTLVLDFDEGAYADASGNLNAQEQDISFGSIEPDAVLPTVTAVHVDSNSREVVLSFSEPIHLPSLVALDSGDVLWLQCDSYARLELDSRAEALGTSDFALVPEYTSGVRLLLAEASRTEINLALRAGDTLLFNYGTSPGPGLVDAALNAVQGITNMELTQLTRDTTPPSILSVTFEARLGRITVLADESLEPTQLDAARIMAEQSLSLGQSALVDDGVYDETLTLELERALMVDLLPLMDNATTITLSFLTSALSDIDGNANTQLFELGLAPDATFFETRIFGVSISQAVRGAPKLVRFVGTGIVAGQTARWVASEDCGAATVLLDTTLADVNSESAFVASVHEDNQGPTQTYERTVAFLEEADPDRFYLCYDGQLYTEDAFRIDVFAVQSVTAATGLSDRIVVDAPKHHTFAGIGVRAGDLVKWVPTSEDCLNDAAAVNHAGEAVLTIEDGLDATLTISRQDGLLEDEELVLCYKFNTEPYHPFPEFALAVSKIVVMESTPLLVAKQTKAISFSGLSLVPDQDKLVWLEVSQAVDDASCDNSSNWLALEPEPELVGLEMANAYISAAPMPPERFRLCYKFSSEPYKLYADIPMTPCEVISYNVSHGSPNVAVVDDPKTFYLHGSGFDAANDRLRWTPDASDSSLCTAFPDGLDSAPRSLTHDSGVATLTFGATALKVFLCVGFGPSEPYQVYDFVELQVRTVHMVDPMRTVAGFNPPDAVTITGFGLLGGDRFKYVPQRSNLDPSLWCDQEPDTDGGRGTTETTTIVSASTGIELPVFFPAPNPTRTEPFLLCYAHGIEPFHLYTALSMLVDGLSSVSVIDVVEGIEDELAFEGPGVLPGDTVRWIRTPEGTAVGLNDDAGSLPMPTDADCETASVVHQVRLTEPAEQGVTFPAVSGTMERHALCYKFQYNASDSRYKIYPEEGFALQALGIREVSLAHVVVGEPAEISYAGTGIQEGDLAKWVDSNLATSNEQCSTAPSLTASAEGETVNATARATHLFIQGAPQAVLCFRFKQNSEWYRVYPHLQLTVNDATKVEPRHVLTGAPQQMLIEVADVRSGDVVKLVPASAASCEVSEGAFAATHVAGILSCQVPARPGSLFAVEMGLCAAINLVVDEDPGEPLTLCYKYVEEDHFSRYTDLLIHVAVPKVEALSAEFFVAGVTKLVELRGTFGITRGDTFKLVQHDVESCEGDEPEEQVSSVVLNDADPADGVALIEVAIAEDAVGLSTKPFRLCYRFGPGDMLLFKERTLQGQKLASVTLLTPIDSATENDDILFRFAGIGISDADKAKWVLKPALISAAEDPELCEGPGLAGSEEESVVEGEAAFRFSEATMDMLLCYKFNDEPYRTYPTLEIAYDPSLEVAAAAAAGGGSGEAGEAAEAQAEKRAAEAALAKEQEAQDTKLQQEAQVTIALDMDFTTVPAGSPAEEEFKADFVADLSAALLIPKERILIKGIRSGSIIVDFVILPPINSTDSLPAESAVAILVEKVLDVSSDLYADSRVMRNVDNTRAVDVVIVPNADALANAHETATAKLAEQQQELQIIAFQKQGLFSFSDSVLVVVEDFDDGVELEVLREHGASGSVTLKFRTRDGTAVSPEAYSGVEGFVRFEDGETRKKVQIPLSADELHGAHFAWFIAELELPEGLVDARLGSRRAALVKIYDYGDGDALVKDSFALETGTSNDTQGWRVTGNRDADAAWVDVHGLYSPDLEFAGREYDERCDTASPAAPCTYSCEFGGGYGETRGTDEGILELDGSGYVVSATQWGGGAFKELTVSLWVRSTAQDAPGTLLSYAVPGEGLPELILHDHRSLVLVIRGKVTDRRVMGIRTGVDVSDGAWHFLAVTWNSAGGEVYVYKDGMLEFEGGPYRADTTIRTGGRFVVGQTQAGGPCDGLGACNFEPERGFRGSMQNLRLWRKARSQKQVQDGMKWPFTAYQGDLRLYWRFTRPSGSTALVGEVPNVALSGGDHFGLLSAAGAAIGEGTPTTHPNYPCGKVHSNVFYFDAPARFLGDLRGLYNGRLQFRLFSPVHHGRRRAARGSVLLISGDTVLSNGLLGFRTADAVSGWRGYSVILTEDHGWVAEPSGLPVTFAEFRSVLSNVTALRIRGDQVVYSTTGSGQETTYLNDIALIRP